MIESMPGIPLGSEMHAAPYRQWQDDCRYIRSTLLIDGSWSVVEHYVSPGCGPYTEAVEVLEGATRHAVHDNTGRLLAFRDHVRSPRRQLIAEGDHRFVITSAEWHLTKRQRDTVKLGLKIVGGASDGLMLWHHLMISKTARRFANPWARERCEQLGISRVALEKVNVDDVPAVFMGREDTVVVWHRDICGNVYADVERFGA